MSLQSVDATGRVIARSYRDVAQTAAQMTYDGNEALSAYSISRTPGPRTSYTRQPPLTTSPPLTLQSVLANVSVSRDLVENPVTVTQAYLRGTAGAVVPSEWPSGAKPLAERDLVYGDDYRVERSNTYHAVTNDVENVVDSFVSPYVPSDGAEYPTPNPPSTGDRGSQFI